MIFNISKLKFAESWPLDLSFKVNKENRGKNNEACKEVKGKSWFSFNLILFNLTKYKNNQFIFIYTSF